MISFESSKLFVIGFIIFVALDIIWLNFIMKSTYVQYLKPNLRMINGSYTPNIPVGLLVWALIVLGIMLFVIPHAQTVQQALIWGGLYGFVLYGVYDLTNAAVLAHWPWPIVWIDLAWGTAVNGIVAALIFLLK